VNSKIYEINFNPFWTVPASIIKKDLIPQMQKNPNYITDYKIRIYDQQGAELQPGRSTGTATKHEVHVPPGPGRLQLDGQRKINFASPEGLHARHPGKLLFNSEFA
jgi:murein L,D-transpeptidase YcbB/YkuD